MMPVTSPPALAAASAQLIERAKARAADLLEAAVDDLTLDLSDGRFHVVGTPSRAVSWGDVAATLDGPLSEEHDFAAPMPTFPSGCHVAVVEVDPETGGVELLRLVGADDAGTIMNPLLADGPHCPANDPEGEA